MNELQERLSFVEAYASFSQSRNGLGKVLGGIVGIVVILTGTLLGGGTVTAIVTLSMTLLWLVGKELIRARLYQPYGVAKERWSEDYRKNHIWSTGFVLVIALGIAGLMLVRNDFNTFEDRLYFALVLAMPVVTWRFLRTPVEFIVGVFLLAACAVHGAGGAYSLIPDEGELPIALVTWSPFIGSFVLIALGLREHRDFQELSQQIESQS